MEKRKKYHDFYLCDIEPEEGSGYMVKQVNSEGKVCKMHNSVPYKTSVDMYLEKIRKEKYTGDERLLQKYGKNIDIAFFDTA